MDVHTHTHTERKRFTHYLWEFLMLFLAVFCGFLAENIREHMIEKRRAKEYIKNFVEDLKIDTTTFSRIIKINELKDIVFEDLFKCYDTIRKNWKSSSCLVSLVRNSRTNSSITFSNGTIQQLKNAGGYRLLSDEDRDSIISYDNSIQAYKDYESTFFQESQDIVRNTASIIVDFDANKFLSRSLAGADSTHTEIPLLFSDDKVLLNKYFNELLRYKSANRGQISQLKNRKTKAETLLYYFKNKYHLE